LVATENNGENDSTLMAGLAALAFGTKITNPEATLNGNSIPDELSTRSSTNSQDSYPIRPFIDPGLVKHKRKNVNETWLSDFVSPTSAPQGAYSPLSQAVKKLLPERAACRLGK
jgi:hypothetical protein